MTEELTTSNTAIITTQDMINCCNTTEAACLLKSKGVPMLDGDFDPSYYYDHNIDESKGIITYTWGLNDNPKLMAAREAKHKELNDRSRHDITLQSIDHSEISRQEDS